MAMGKRGRQRQENLFIASNTLVKSPGHPFYEKLNQVLGGERLRQVRRGALPAVLRSSYGSQGHSARGLFSDAFDWVFRGT